MLSRAADCMYWLSRYVERAENVARFINVNLLLMLDLPPDLSGQWEPLVTTTGDREAFLRRYDEASRDNVLHFLTFDTENPNSILSCLRKARENAIQIRDTVSIELWEALNRHYLMVNDAASTGRIPYDPHGFYSTVLAQSHLFRGALDSTISHGEAWSFARVGRLLERADKTSRILDVKYFILLPQASDVGSPVDYIQWAALLRSASALQMYRQRHHRILPDKVAEFLILDGEFPRSIRYCVAKAEEALHAISGTPMRQFANPAEKQLGRLRGELDFMQIDEIISTGLHEYLDGFQVKLNEVGAAVFETFFAVRQIAGAVAANGRGDASDVLLGHASA